MTLDRVKRTVRHPELLEEAALIVTLLDSGLYDISHEIHRKVIETLTASLVEYLKSGAIRNKDAEHTTALATRLAKHLIKTPKG